MSFERMGGNKHQSWNALEIPDSYVGRDQLIEGLLTGEVSEKSRIGANGKKKKKKKKTKSNDAGIILGQPV